MKFRCSIAIVMSIALVVVTAFGCCSQRAFARAVGAGPPSTDPVPQTPRWAHVTAAGNAPYTYFEPGLGDRAIGRVDSDFYIRQTEVTGSEWFEFVNAVKPYMTTDLRLGSTFLGGYTRWDLFADGSVTYYLDAPGINRPVDVAWRYAAMYSNWLHNNKGTTLSSFLTGAYTLDSTLNNTLPFTTREPGARYWIPSEDEWVKAAFFDPHRFGPDQPGYWQYPNSSNTELVSGQPGTGAQTSAGLQLSFMYPYRPEIGAYPETTSPWGLLDVSGGFGEWTDSQAYSGGTIGEWYGYAERGSQYGDLLISDVTDDLTQFPLTDFIQRSEPRTLRG